MMNYNYNKFTEPVLGSHDVVQDVLRQNKKWPNLQIHTAASNSTETANDCAMSGRDRGLG